MIDNRSKEHQFNGTVKLDGRSLDPSGYAFDEGACAVTLKLTPGEHIIEIIAALSVQKW